MACKDFGHSICNRESDEILSPTRAFYIATFDDILAPLTV